MIQVESKHLKERELPRNIDYYEVDENGVVHTCDAIKADVYIEESDVIHFTDKEVMLYIRAHYGNIIGVMRDIQYVIHSKEYRTPKILLGVVRGFTKEK